MYGELFPNLYIYLKLWGNYIKSLNELKLDNRQINPPCKGKYFIKVYTI